jgi:predicted acylesterase/phospholipase RssA
VLPPVPDGENLLVDGGVLNNLPFDEMRADGTIETVIAVDVAPARGPRAKSDYGLSVSGLRALGSTITRRGHSYPTVSAILLRSMLTGAVRNQNDALRDEAVDLMLQLHLPGIGLLDFDRVRDVAQAGEDASLPQIRQWASEQPWLAGRR